MKSWLKIILGLTLLAGTSLILLRPVDLSPPPPAQLNRAPSAPKGTENVEQVWVSETVEPTISVDARELPPVEFEPTLDREINPRLTHNLTDPDLRLAGGLDPLLALQSRAPAAAPSAFLSPTINIAGQGYSGVRPPDTIGEVGPNHYVQMINSTAGTAVQIYDKSGNPQGSAWALDSLGSGNCANGHGDPIVLYDPLADRWLLSEFARYGNHLCVYISTTPDPAGSYYAYDFVTPNFPDYPKYALWPDAYYVSSNENSPAAYALDRNQMLIGAAASMQRFSAPSLSGFVFNTLIPSDLDGATPPPAGAPNYFMRHVDTEAHGSPSAQDFLELWEFHVDWGTPANSTFVQTASIPITEIDSDLCGLVSFYCFPQPGTGTTLDPLREVVMWRLQYRNFVAYQTLVGNLVTDVDGTDHGGIRWFELRKTGANPWTLHQEGTFAPDSHHRWMGSAAMDGNGNIAIGYSVSSSSLYPSIRYAGRLANDPPGMLPLSEGVIITGTSSQSASTRWGDYSSINLDPADDCTFWYTNEYLDGGYWATQIASFKFDQCGTPGFSLQVAPAEQAICSPDDAVFDVQVSPVLSYTGSVTLSAAGYPAGSTANFAHNPVTVPSSTTLTISNTGAAAAGSYAINVYAIAPTQTHTSTVQLELCDISPIPVPLLSPSNHQTDVGLTPTFSWAAVPQASTYVWELTTDLAFSNIIYSATTTQTSYTLGSNLDYNTSYYWRVQAHNVCGAGAFSESFTFSTIGLPGECTGNTTPNLLYTDDFESGAPGWSHSGTSDTWELSTDRPHGGSYAYYATDLDSISDQQLQSPAIALPIGESPLTLQFWNYQEIESSPSGCYDGGLLEISTNGGVSWIQLETELLTDPYDGPVNTDYSNPLGGLNAWCGNPQDWLKSIVNLDAFAGQIVRFRFRLGTDSSVSKEGWHLDDLVVQSCQDAGPQPSIVLTKTVGTDPNTCASTNTLTVPAGTDVTYCYTVQNSSALSLTHHTLVDDQLGTLLSDHFYVLSPQGTPHDSWWFTHTANITQTTTNVASWTASAGVEYSAEAIDIATVTVPELNTLYLPLLSNNQSYAPDLVVHQITANRQDLQLVIENQGTAATINDFWVDVYLDPMVAPTGVNQLWWHLGTQGIAWGVTESLAPGETLTFTFATSDPGYTQVTWPLAPNTEVYAQVDSWNQASVYGAVLEDHELGGVYNNIFGPVYVNSKSSYENQE